MADRIKMTPSEIENTIRTIKSCNDEMRSQYQRLDACLQDAASRWEGQARQAFMERYEGDLRPVLNDTLPMVLEATWQKLDAARQAIIDTDQAIAGAFRG